MSNLKVWTDGLRSTNIQQTTGQLGVVYDGATQMCCLGFGCTLVPEMENDIQWQANEDDDTPSVGAVMMVDLADGEWSDSMPPVAFHEWIGATPQGGKLSGDVLPDWPAQEFTMPRPGAEWHDRDGLPYRSILTCAKLNDSAGLTFVQIADVVDYFGVV